MFVDSQAIGVIPAANGVIVDSCPSGFQGPFGAARRLPRVFTDTAEALAYIGAEIARIQQQNATEAARGIVPPLGSDAA